MNDYYAYTMGYYVRAMPSNGVGVRHSFEKAFTTYRGRVLQCRHYSYIAV